MAKRKETVETLWLTIVNGKLATYVAEPTNFSEPVVDTKGRTKNYEFFDEVEGKLEQVYVYDKEIADSTVFEMLAVKVRNSEGNLEFINIPFKSKYAQAFIKRLENINLEKTVTIKCFKIEDKEKTAEKGKKVYNEMLLPYQNGKSVANPYSKESGKKLSEAIVTAKKIKGATVKTYDFTDMEEDLRVLVKNANDSLLILKKEADYVARVKDSNVEKELESLEVDEIYVTENEDLAF